jgi:RNA polymerase sigma-70 factor (ECF subfamily)
MTAINEQFVRDLTACQALLFGYVLSLLPDVDQASDVLQETNVELWRKADEFEPGSNFIAWAYSIARFKVLSFLRDTKRDRHLFSVEVLELLADQAVCESESRDPQARAFEQCFASLPADQRELLRERYAPGGSVKRMAAERGRSAGGLSVALNRLRTALGECIERKLASGTSS